LTYKTIPLSAIPFRQGFPEAEYFELGFASPDEWERWAADCDEDLGESFVISIFLAVCVRTTNSKPAAIAAPIASTNI
jgi:hypothetical protein